jgi:hypothetical protein
VEGDIFGIKQHLRRGVAVQIAEWKNGSSSDQHTENR